MPQIPNVNVLEVMSFSSSYWDKIKYSFKEMGWKYKVSSGNLITFLLCYKYKQNSISCFVLSTMRNISISLFKTVDKKDIKL